VTIQEIGAATSSATGGGNISTAITSTGRSTITVRYNYTPTNGLQPGPYTLSCPNSDKDDNGVLVVTGKALPAQGNAAAAPLLAKATARYRAYVVAQTAQLLTGTRRFVAALSAGDLEREGHVRPGAAPLRQSSPSPRASAARPRDRRARQRRRGPRWTGSTGSNRSSGQGTTAGTGPLARKLLADVEELERRVRTLSFQPAQLANGAVELLNEVAGSKITGEEDRYSHTDLSDFQGNLTGARVAFDLLRPALVERGEQTLVRTIGSRF
jgi:iron uptake system component EfeO